MLTIHPSRLAQRPCPVSRHRRDFPTRTHQRPLRDAPSARQRLYRPARHPPVVPPGRVPRADREPPLATFRHVPIRLRRLPAQVLGRRVWSGRDCWYGCSGRRGRGRGCWSSRGCRGPTGDSSRWRDRLDSEQAPSTRQFRFRNIGLFCPDAVTPRERRYQEGRWRVVADHRRPILPRAGVASHPVCVWTSPSPSASSWRSSSLFTTTLGTFPRLAPAPSLPIRHARPFRLQLVHLQKTVAVQFAHARFRRSRLEGRRDRRVWHAGGWWRRSRSRERECGGREQCEQAGQSAEYTEREECTRVMPIDQAILRVFDPARIALRSSRISVLPC